jgi:hypothetical protein
LLARTSGHRTLIPSEPCLLLQQPAKVCVDRQHGRNRRSKTLTHTELAGERNGASAPLSAQRSRWAVHWPTRAADAASAKQREAKMLRHEVVSALTDAEDANKDERNARRGLGSPNGPRLAIRSTMVGLDSGADNVVRPGPPSETPHSRTPVGSHALEQTPSCHRSTLSEDPCKQLLGPNSTGAPPAIDTNELFRLVEEVWPTTGIANSALSTFDGCRDAERRLPCTSVC